MLCARLLRPDKGLAYLGPRLESTSALTSYEIRFSLAAFHDMLELRRIDVLLESGHPAVFDVPDVANLRVDALTSRLVPPAVATFNDDAVASIVK